MQWYKVTTKMPDESKKVLCVIEKNGKKEMEIGKWTGKFWIVGNFFEWDIGKVILWGELPLIPD